MNSMIWILVLVLAVSIVASLAWAVRRWKSVAATRLITCPETGKREAVVVDPLHRASHAVAGQPDMRLRSCSRWPEREDCDQACLTQIAQAPDGCRVHALLDAFYAGKLCTNCGRAIGHAGDWAQHVPGLRLDDGSVKPWTEVPAQSLDEVLGVAQPTCWECAQIARVYQEHPELVTERPARKWEVAR